MGRVTALVEFIEVEGDHGSVDGVEVTCSKCHHSEECPGTSDRSISRAAALLRENCPQAEMNFYDPDEGGF